MPIAALVLVPAGVAVAAAASGGTPAQTTPTNVSPQGGVWVGGGAAPGATIGGLLATGGSVSVGTTSRPPKSGFGNSGLFATIATSQKNGDFPVYSQTDAEVQKKLDEIESWGEKAFDKLNAAAKKAGCNYLNDKYKLDPPLKGDEKWTEIGLRIAGPVGGEAGQAIGESFGGPAGSIIGEKLGAFFGAKISEFINRNGDEIEAWFKDKYGDLKDWVNDNVEQPVKDAVDWFENIF